MRVRAWERWSHKKEYIIITHYDEHIYRFQTLRSDVRNRSNIMWGKIQLKETSLSHAKSLQILISVTYNQIIAYSVWLCNCIKLCVNLVKLDWYESWQAQIVAIRQTLMAVTHMSDVIKEILCYVVFKKNAVCLNISLLNSRPLR